MTAAGRPLIKPVRVAAIALKASRIVQQTPSRWTRFLAAKAVEAIDVVAFGEPAVKPIRAPVAGNYDASFGNMHQTRAEAGLVKNILDAETSIDAFRMLPYDCLNFLSSLHALPSGGLEIWQAYHFATDTTSPLRRPITLVVNSADVANDYALLRSELVCSLWMMLSVLYATPFPSQALADGQICATVFSLVQAKTRVLHASVDQGRAKVEYSRYFDNASAVEGLLAAALLTPKPTVPVEIMATRRVQVRGVRPRAAG